MTELFTTVDGPQVEPFSSAVSRELTGGGNAHVVVASCRASLLDDTARCVDPYLFGQLFADNVCERSSGLRRTHWSSAATLPARQLAHHDRAASRRICLIADVAGQP